MQKKVNTAGLTLLSLEKPACKFDHWPAAGNLDFRSVPPFLTDKVTKLLTL